MQEKQINLFALGSCECDQFQAGNQVSQSRKPIRVVVDFKNVFPLHQQIGIKQQFYQIRCGALHTLALTNYGRVFSWGCNDDGALGRISQQDTKTPQLVKLPCAVNMISCGSSHSSFLNSRKHLFYFTGVFRNSSGKLVEVIKEPLSIDIKRRIPQDQTIRKLQSGSDHCFILAKKRVYLIGDQDYYTIGRMSKTRTKLKAYQKIQATQLKNVVDAWSGNYHIVAKCLEKYDVYHYYSWGLNSYGQLGIGSYENYYQAQQIQNLQGIDIVKVAGGESHTMALTSKGQVYVWGRNDDGQLGLGEQFQQQKRQEEDVQQTKYRQECKQKQKSHEQRVRQFRNAYQKKCILKPILNKHLSNISNIYSGSDYNYCLKNLSNTQQEVYTWGIGFNYVLINGHQQNQYLPFKVKKSILKDQFINQIGLGSQHVCYLSSQSQCRIEMQKTVFNSQMSKQDIKKR